MESIENQAQRIEFNNTMTRRKSVLLLVLLGDKPGVDSRDADDNHSELPRCCNWAK